MAAFLLQSYTFYLFSLQLIDTVGSYLEKIFKDGELVATIQSTG